MFSSNKFSYESKLLDLLQSKFFSVARRNKILAKWAGGRLGYKDNVLNKYVRKIIFLYLIAPDDKKIIDKIMLDFKNAHISITEEAIRKKIKLIEGRVQAKLRIEHVS